MIEYLKNHRKGSNKVYLGLLLITSVASTAYASPQQRIKLAQLPNSVPAIVSKSMPTLAIGSSVDLIVVAISLKPKDALGLQKFADAVSKPSSARYRQFISPEEIGVRFGAEKRDVDSVVAFFLTNGLKITHIGKTNITVSATGTQAQVEAAFQTKLANLSAPESDGNYSYRSNVTPIKVPADLVSKIQSVNGLETYYRPKRRVTTLNPTQTRTLYSLNTPFGSGWTGAGRKIGISNWDGYRLANLPLFYSQFSLPTPSGGIGSNVHEIAVDGSTIASGTAGIEGDLDIQMVLGTSPLADLYVYSGLPNSAGLVSLLSREASDNTADIITESYGWFLDSLTAETAHTHHLTMSAAGITYCAASGDNGTNFGNFDYPDYEPEVLQVGGTVANTNMAGVRMTEVAWSLSGGLGGGGGWCSSAAANAVSFNVRPPWQVGNGVPSASIVNKRLVPDIALHASGAAGGSTAGFTIYFNGVLFGALGTSASSPLFAGSLANVQQRLYSTGGRGLNTNNGRLGRIQDRIYAQNGRTDVWFDVTTGNIGNLPLSGGGALNGTPANATVNWDFATGWGAMNFDSFYKTFFEGR